MLMCLYLTSDQVLAVKPHGCNETANSFIRDFALFHRSSVWTSPLKESSSH